MAVERQPGLFTNDRLSMLGTGARSRPKAMDTSRATRSLVQMDPPRPPEVPALAADWFRPAQPRTGCKIGSTNSPTRRWPGWNRLRHL